MRIFLPLSALLILLGASCGDDEQDPAPDPALVLKVMDYVQDQDPNSVIQPRGFVAPGNGPQDCLIPTAGGQFVEAKCEWKIEQTSDGGWLVRYFETWDCDDYNAVAGNADRCPGESGTREWDYQITPDGTTELFTQSGDPPPETLGSGAPNQ
jgi:hypothetical protein